VASAYSLFKRRLEEVLRYIKGIDEHRETLLERMMAHANLLLKRVYEKAAPG
jgi:N-acetylglucosamine kinase-like BadF-type ATPase